MKNQGTILILVAGIASILSVTCVVILISVRNNSETAQTIAKDAQARIMLSAALHYIQEASRIGWGEETFGWTDVRDGSIGPRGNHGTDPTDTRTNYASGSTFPNLGCTMRGDTYCVVIPPYAISPHRALNPYIIDPAARPSDDPTTFFIDAPRPDFNNWNSLISERFDKNQIAMLTNGVGALSPQSIVNTWDEFKTGNPRPLPESMNRGWFRIYRESSSERNGIPGDVTSSNGATDWYDTIPMPSSHGVFIITVGAGSTRGFRFWDGSGKDYLNGDLDRTSSFNAKIEPLTASASGLFTDRETFASQRSQELIYWYRAEWTSAISGVDSWINANTGGGGAHNLINQEYNRSMGAFFPSQGGTFRWIKRLDREPPNW